MRKIGVSIVSLWPYYFDIRDTAFEVAMGIARKSGLAGLQVLPMRGLNLSALKNYSNYIISYEGKWNWGTWSQAVNRLFNETLYKVTGIKSNNYKYPSLIDMLFFQERDLTRLNGPLKIVHHFNEVGNGEVLEVSPRGLAYDFLAYADIGGKLCFDPSNFEGIKDWKQLCASVDPSAVALLDANFDNKEVAQILAGKNPPVLQRMDLMMKRPYGFVPIILELRPNPYGWNALIDQLSALRRLLLSRYG